MNLFCYPSMMWSVLSSMEKRGYNCQPQKDEDPYVFMSYEAAVAASMGENYGKNIGC